LKRSLGYNIFNYTNILFFALVSVLMFFPFYQIFITSIITVGEFNSRPLVLWPKNPTLEAYRFIFSSNDLIQSAGITVFVTIAGTAMSMLVTLCLAYALSKSFLPGGKKIHRIILFTMFIDSGLIPYFLMVRSLGLVNNIFVNIVPSLVSLWNYLVIRSFFKQLPASLEEAALVDGAGWWTIFFRIVLPISKPIIASFTLFYAVGYWNSWWNSMLFCPDVGLQTLQLFVRRLVVTGEMTAMLSEAHSAAFEGANRVYSEAIKMAACFAAIVPILCVYPFLQKHFAKGVLIGSLKG